MGDEGRRRAPSLDELRAALAERADARACRRFDEAVAAGERLTAIRIARDHGVAVDDDGP